MTLRPILALQYRLPNGLQILLLPDSSAPVATVMIVYRVGSRNEAVGYTGATHMLEHMLFKGTPAFNKEKGTQIAVLLESVGADYLDRYPESIKSVSKTQVDDAIRRHFHPDLSTVVVAGELARP